MNDARDRMDDLPPFSDVLSGLLEDGYAVRFKADGDSMWPTIRSGDVITAVPVAAATVQTGDIVVCRSDRRWLVHRVTEIRAAADREATSTVVLRGDAKRGCDAPLRLSAVVARVTSVERDGIGRWFDGRMASFRDCVRRRLYRDAAASRPTATPWAA